jgi:hypothetical protein
MSSPNHTLRRRARAAVAGSGGDTVKSEYFRKRTWVVKFEVWKQATPPSLGSFFG